MRNYKILVGFMVVFFVACLSVSTAVQAGRSDDDSRSGHKKKGNKLKALQEQINSLQEQLDNIELSAGPAGADGADGVDGINGTNGVDGQGGLSIQGPQGESGQSGIGDMNTVCDGTTTGMIRYNTDNSAFEGCDGTAWVSLNATGDTYAIGDNGPAGGVVFYITDGGLHGLEAAPTDQSNGSQWGCYETMIAGADGTAVRTGAQNTSEILAGCSEAGTAAEIADAYLFGGYEDWYLPSKDELNLLYQQKDVVGGFADTYYWSSTELDSIQARDQYFGNGYQSNIAKYNGLRVRAVRAF